MEHIERAIDLFERDRRKTLSEFYLRQGLASDDAEIVIGSAYSLSAAAIFLNSRYRKLFELGKNSTVVAARYAAGLSLAGLPQSDFGQFVYLCRKSSLSQDVAFLSGVSQAIAQVNETGNYPRGRNLEYVLDEFTAIFSKYQSVFTVDLSGIGEYSDSLAEMAVTLPREFLRLYEANAMHPISEVRRNSAGSLKAYIESLSRDRLGLSDPLAAEFIKNYLTSRYSANKSQAKLAREIRQFATDLTLDYQALNRTLSANQREGDMERAKDIDEIRECARIIVDGYTVISRLGEGGFMKVYRAKDPTGYPVALKVFGGPRLDYLMKMTGFSIEQLTENTAWSSITIHSHQNICNLYTLKSHDDKIVFGEELLNYTLKSYLAILRDKNERMPEAIVKNVAISLFSALAYTHNRGQIHGDVKSDNIGVTYESTIKFSDFGIRTNIFNLFKDRNLARNEYGSIFYRGPEHYERYAPFYTSDIYSVGVVLAECALGKHPLDFFLKRSELDLTPGKKRDLSMIRIYNVITTKGYYDTIHEMLDTELSDSILRESIKGCLLPNIEIRDHKKILHKYNRVPGLGNRYNSIEEIPLYKKKRSDDTL